MKDLLDKLSSYNIFNYLFPGVVFAATLQWTTHYSLIQKDIVVDVFLYYFIGLVVSRFGSLIIEPILKKLSFLKFADYKDFIVASKKDEMINLFSEMNNIYRTLCSLFSLLLLLKLYEKIESIIPGLQEWNLIILTVSLLIMFLFSYRKQTDYVRKRVKAVA